MSRCPLLSRPDCFLSFVPSPEAGHRLRRLARRSCMVLTPTTPPFRLGEPRARWLRHSPHSASAPAVVRQGVLFSWMRAPSSCLDRCRAWGATPVPRTRACGTTVVADAGTRGRLRCPSAPRAASNPRPFPLAYAAVWAAGARAHGSRRLAGEGSCGSWGARLQWLQRLWRRVGSRCATFPLA